MLLMFWVWSCGSRRVGVSFFRAEKKGSSGGGLDAMRTKASKAKRRPACGAAMKRNGRTRAGTQRWMCVTCSPTGVMRQRDAERGRQLDAFPGWPLGRASRSACDANGDSRAPRKRNAWCRNIRPAIPPCRVRHHTVMADGTYMGPRLVPGHVHRRRKRRDAGHAMAPERVEGRVHGAVLAHPRARRADHGRASRRRRAHAARYGRPLGSSAA